MISPQFSKTMGPLSEQSSCPICYDTLEDSPENCTDEDDENQTRRSSLRLGCTHSFCHTCLRQYCDIAIQQRRFPIQCPESNCNAQLTEQEMLSILICETDAKRYHHAYQRAMDPSLLECSNCAMLLTPKTTTSLQCPCGHEFCSIHGDAHTGQTCQEYTAKSDFLSTSVIQCTTKPCPHCTVRIEKEGGCDHIVCPSCNGDWCWKCQNPNLTGDAIRYCSRCNVEYLDHRRRHKRRLYVCLTFPCRLLLTLSYLGGVLIACVVFVLSCGCVGRAIFLYKPSQLRQQIWDLVLEPTLFILFDFGFSWGGPAEVDHFDEEEGHVVNS